MEQMIIFVYDSGYCQTEADDPQKAVLYFHPHWVSDQQRLALCGQLMGATYFCSTVFSSPKVLTLQCGKFVLKKFSRYVLSVGSDQTLAEWILKERFNMLELLLQFYHNSFDSIYVTCGCDQESFSKRLTEILEVYVPILQYIVSSFGTVLLVGCPKKNSAAFLEAFQLLEACCSFKGVLGGAILQNSRVIATQLDPDITKLLALSDKFQTRTQAEKIEIQYNLPVGVQLIKVYLQSKMFETLQNIVNLKSSMCNGVQKKFSQKANNISQQNKDNKIFTLLEEDCNFESAASSNENPAILKEAGQSKQKKSKSRFDINVLKERSKSFIGGLNLKVCLTPTVEKNLVHEELVSICNSGNLETALSKSSSFIPDVSQSATSSKKNKLLAPTKYRYNRLYRISTDDLMIDLSQKTYPVLLKYYSFGLPKVCRETNILEKKKSKKKIFNKTIADPMNPVFRFDGIPVSKSLYNSYLDEHYKDFMMANITIDSREEFLKSKNLKIENVKKKATLNYINHEHDSNKISNKNNSNCIQTLNFKLENVVSENVGKEELLSRKQKAARKSLSLPLKPLFDEVKESKMQNSVINNKVLYNRTPTTPLTTKLSLLTFEEQIEVKPLPPPPSDTNQFKNIILNQKDLSDTKNKNQIIASSLFAYVYQNMTILLLLDENIEKNPDLIISLWEKSSTTLKKVEHLRNKNVANLSASLNNNLSYSFLLMDNNWGTIQKSGSWEDEELKTVGCLHYDLNKASNITEIILRNEDSVIYGYSCGGSKIFYQQSGCSSAGLPTPADLMGMVTLKARRRLERDRDIVLL